jgi:hypothetical protein
LQISFIEYLESLDGSDNFLTPRLQNPWKGAPHGLLGITFEKLPKNDDLIGIY